MFRFLWTSVFIYVSALFIIPGVQVKVSQQEPDKHSHNQIEVIPDGLPHLYFGPVIFRQLGGAFDFAFSDSAWDVKQMFLSNAPKFMLK